MKQLILPWLSSPKEFKKFSNDSLWSYSKTTLFRDTTKRKVLVFVCFDSFVIALFMEYNTTHLVDFHDIHLNSLAFQKKQNTWIFSRQSSEKVAYRPGLDYLLQRFLPRTSAQVISICPKNVKKKLKWENCRFHPFPPPLPRYPPDRTPMISLGHSRKTCKQSYWCWNCFFDD